jgi:DNA-binding transcriptional LysR family regulator
VSWQALAKYPWIIQMIGRQRTLLEKLLTSNNAGWPQQLTECGSVDFIKSLVASSDSLAMLPASAVSADVRDGRIRPIDIVEPLMHRDIAVIFRERSPLSAAARELVSSIAEAGMGQSGEESAGRQEQQAA